MRLIDADALKDKLQQHHDFYVMAWGGFGKMPIGEKKRVDEITNCIAEVVNAPTIEPKRGEWKPFDLTWGRSIWYCTACEEGVEVPCDIWTHKPIYNFCPNCGADMRNCSEKPNNCEPQTYVINPQEPTNDEKCFECDDFFTCGGQCNKIEDEPQTEDLQDWKDRMWAEAIVIEPITEDCSMVSCLKCEHNEHCHYLVKDIPWPDCPWKRRYEYNRLCSIINGQ